MMNYWNTIYIDQINIIFNIKKSNLNLEAWWPPNLEQDEKKLQQLKIPKIYITGEKVVKFNNFCYILQNWTTFIKCFIYKSNLVAIRLSKHMS
jgi:hypothetical protein